MNNSLYSLITRLTKHIRNMEALQPRIRQNLKGIVYEF